MCDVNNRIDIECRLVGGDVLDGIPDIDNPVPCTLTPSGPSGLTGFGCVNDYQPDNACEDYEIRVKCSFPGKLLSL